MNTPAHALVAVASLAGGSRLPYARYALLGGVLPDLPIFGFYLFQKAMVGSSEAQIWNEAYFRADWQLFFDAFNSAPVALLGIGLAGLFATPMRNAAQVFFGAVLLHVALDLPLHHDDAHRHFLPLGDFRFESPISYWDPAHAGALGAGIEVACVLGACAILFRRYPSPWTRSLLGALSLVSLAGYTFLYWIVEPEHWL